MAAQAHMRASGGELRDVIALEDPLCGPAIAGAKAGNLSLAGQAGLPIIPGFVITTSAACDPMRVLASEVLVAAWQELSDGGRRPLVVRSSSVAEDIAESSMAGMFTSVVDVTGWEEFVSAVSVVLDSASNALLGGAAQPMAVLVQRFIDAPVGGIMFGLDPVSGRRDRLVVVAAEGPPEALVSGRATGVHYLLGLRGRVAERHGDGIRLGRKQRTALANLARRASRTFGGPQDIEWAFDGAGRIWLLQSRPITAAASIPDPRSRLYGTGPIAETFPDALSPLERDLWIEPLRLGLLNALGAVGATPRRRIHASEVVLSIGGRAAVDLDLLGAAPASPSLLKRLDPRPAIRRLMASWRVGRMRACVPLMADDLRTQVQAELEAVPSLRELSNEALIGLIRRTTVMLACLHGQEILAGILMTPADRSDPAAALGLASLARARAEGLDDGDIPAAYPEVLVLWPPKIGAPPRMPARVTPPEATEEPTPLALAREGLRTIERIVQELSARVALELGRRAAARWILADGSEVRWLTLEELELMISTGRVPLGLSQRSRESIAAPLPSTFRVAADGTVVEPSTDHARMGSGAGGGRGFGAVVKDPSLIEIGDVLVVRNLDPRLATALPMISGLVSESGSVLSHLAILAREFNVPTVVGMAGACDRFPEGATVIVDGNLGEVVVLEGGDSR